MEFSIKTPRGDRLIGDKHNVFIIAELSANHQQDYNQCLQMIDAAIQAGADAIKLQTYTADTLTLDCDNEFFRIKEGPWQGKTLHELYREAYTPWEWQSKLKAYAESKGVLLFSTPFDISAVDFLESIDVALYKISSFESAHIPLLKRIAATKKPVIMSRGGTSLEQLKESISILKNGGCPAVVVLHCVSIYPAKPEDMNLSTIPKIRELGVLSGLSDHTLNVTIPIASVALGATVIEKHFTLSRAKGGPDSSFSLEPPEFAQMVAAVRETQVALGSATFEPIIREQENLKFRSSIFVSQDIKATEKFTSDNIRIIRPGYGIHPREYESTLGRIATRDLERGTPLRLEDIE